MHNTGREVEARIGKRNKIQIIHRHDAPHMGVNLRRKPIKKVREKII